MSVIKHRFESFGGILALENPPMLVHVDKDFETTKKPQRTQRT